VPIYLLDAGRNLVGWSDGVVTPDAPPATPTGLQVTSVGDGSVSLAWTANTENDIASYRVKRSRNDIVVGTPAHPTTTLTVTGLTNGIRHFFTIEAVDAAGNISAASAEVEGTPAVPQSSTIFGYNTNEDGATLSSRLVKWDNRAPMVRRYLSTYLTSGTFGITTAIAPEKRVAYSFKADGSGTFTIAGLAAGAGNARLTAWCNSIPAGWDVILTYFHEVNDDIREGRITPTQFTDTYAQFRQAIDAATLNAGTTVRLACNFMAYQIANTPAFFDDSWVPPTSVCDLMTFDLYGNPGHFTSLVLTPNCPSATGPEYGASFPNVTTRWRDTLEAIVRNGYKDAWGILEHNTPPRDFDGPTNAQYVCGADKRLRYQGGRTASGHDTSHTEVERAAWLSGSVDYCLSQPTILGETLGRPAVWLFWEHPAGTNWNQKFYHDNVWNALKPYITGTPAGG
jgi:hypothetical protein